MKKFFIFLALLFSSCVVSPKFIYVDCTANNSPNVELDQKGSSAEDSLNGNDIAPTIEPKLK